MAVGLAVASAVEGNYNGHITWFVVLSCLMAGMGGVIFGYDIGISGPSHHFLPFFGMLLIKEKYLAFFSFLC